MMRIEKIRLMSHLPIIPSSEGFLLSRLLDYRRDLKNRKAKNKNIDLVLANQLAVGYETLLQARCYKDCELSTIEGGITYLISEIDDIPDHETNGFTDDAEVFNYICELCERTDLKIAQ